MIVLDTHVWIWWLASPHNLSNPASEVIKASQDSEAIYISSMSVWELNMLVAKGRLTLNQTPQTWLKHSESLSFINFTEVNNQIAQNSVHLDMHPDPADRIIAATALYLGVPLVTKDEKLQEYGSLNTVW